ncbi:MAG: hypothetical protein JW809_14820 [Pirellulales bacterium]|nr:hypothetical protein [Pirellulales bacterium]
MRRPDVTIRGTRHAGAHEAIQHLSVSADNDAIAIGGTYLTVPRAEADRLESAGVPFARLFDRDGRIVAVPTGRDGPATARTQR